jgi:hypothetical protein
VRAVPCAICSVNAYTCGLAWRDDPRALKDGDARQTTLLLKLPEHLTAVTTKHPSANWSKLLCMYTKYAQERMKQELSQAPIFFKSDLTWDTMSAMNLYKCSKFTSPMGVGIGL